MFSIRPFRKHSLVGLDIGSQFVKAIVSKTTKNGFIIENIGMAQHSPGAFEGYTMANLELISQTITKLWKNLELKSQYVVTAVPGNEVIMETPVIPVMKRDKLESYMTDNIRQFLFYSPDEVFYDFDILNTNESTNEMTLVVVCTKRGTIYDFEKIATISNLNIAIVDVDYYALFNAFEATAGISPSETILLMDIGASKTIAVIVDKGIPVYYRAIMTGSSELVFQICDKFDVSPQDALRFISGWREVVKLPEKDVKALLMFFIDQICIEIRQTFDHFSTLGVGMSKIDQIYLSGGIAKDREITHQFEHSLGIPVKIFNPFEYPNVRAGKNVDEEYLKFVGPQMAVCFGLSLRRKEAKQK